MTNHHELGWTVYSISTCEVNAAVRKCQPVKVFQLLAKKGCERVVVTEQSSLAPKLLTLNL